MKKHAAKYILFLTIAFLVIFCYQSCAHFFDHAEEVYTSPGGTYTIAVRYDLASRPDVYKKGVLWDKKIWDYPNPGFMETVHFRVEWLSENQIRLSYNDVSNDNFDEEYMITIPE